MRVAYLAPEFYPPWGGVGIYGTELVKELSKKVQVDVFTPTRGKGYDRKAIESKFGNRIEIINIGQARDEFIYNLFFQIGVARRFPGFMKERRYDIVHSANLVHMPDIFLKLRGFRMNSVVTAHTSIRGQVTGFLSSNRNFFRMAPSEKGSLLGYPYIRLMEKAYLKRTTDMITVSRKFARYFREEEGYKGRLETVYNGIDTGKFNPSRTKRTGRFKELEDKGFIVLYAGRLITQKGIKDFVEMMSRAKGDMHFAIAGKGDVDGLKSLLSEYNIPRSRYTFLGFVNNEELPELYRMSSVFVLPSYYENFPISLLEAMSMRCCAVSTDVGAVDEIIEHRKTGLLCRPKDPLQLTAHVEELYRDSSLRKRLAQAGYRKVTENFTTKRMAEGTLAFYRRMQG